MTSNKKILLVDDDSFMREWWTELFTQFDFAVDLDVAVSESFAKKIIANMKDKGQVYEVIICDIFLSGNRTGIDLWKGLQDKPRNFVFTSGVPKDRFEMMIPNNCTNCHFLEKPFLFEDCLNLLSKVLNIQSRSDANSFKQEC